MVANLLSRPHRSHPLFRPRCCFHCFESWDEQLEPARSQISSRSIGRHQTSDQDGRFTCMFPVFWWTPFSASCVASFPTVQPQGWNTIASFTKTWQNSFTKKHEPWILECQPCSDEHHVPQNELKSEEGAKHIFDNNKAKICLAGQYEETSGQSQEPYSMFQIYIQIPSCLPSGDNAVNAWRNPALYLLYKPLRECQHHWTRCPLKSLVSFWFHLMLWINYWYTSPYCRIWAQTSEIWSFCKGQTNLRINIHNLSTLFSSKLKKKRTLFDWRPSCDILWGFLLLNHLCNPFILLCFSDLFSPRVGSSSLRFAPSFQTAFRKITAIVMRSNHGCIAIRTKTLSFWRTVSTSSARLFRSLVGILLSESWDLIDGLERTNGTFPRVAGEAETNHHRFASHAQSHQFASHAQSH